MPKTLIQSVITQLQKEQHRLESELRGVRAALTAFGKAYMKGTKARKRTISAAGRRRIAAAQRARWAKFRTQSTKARRRGK